MTTGQNQLATCPLEILDWLPWYADDGLSESQRGAVEAHAAQCEECRTELAMLRGDPLPELAVPDPEPIFANVLARIEAAGAASGSVASGGHLVPAAAHRAPLRPAIRSRSHLASRLAAAAVLALVAVGGWLAHDLSVPAQDSVYRTASDSGAAGAVSGLALDVVFRTGISIERINTNLRALGAVMVAGPSEAGRYRVTLPVGSNPAAAAAMLRAEETGVATFAEPVRP